MTLTHGLLFGLATFALVFLMGFQSRNVNSGQYVSAALTSIVIGGSQIEQVRSISLGSPWVAFWITAVAGPAAICSAMFLHRKVFNE